MKHIHQPNIVHTSQTMIKWWRSIDNKLFIAILILLAIGVIALTTASPAAAGRIGASPFIFLQKQIIYIAASITLLITISAMNEKTLRVLIKICFLCTLLLLILLPIFGDKTKGAMRWISIFSISLQPSELLKPFYAAIIAMLLAKTRDVDSEIGEQKYFTKCIILHVFVIALILIQPDFGMAVTISVATGAQLFIAGLPMHTIFVLLALLVAMLAGAYVTFPHIAARLGEFFSNDSANGDVVGMGYQVSKSLASYTHGGLFGVGPGEGTVKYSLPDSHTDFIFAVLGEEFGVICCMLIVGVMMFVVIRGFVNTSKMYDPYRIYVSIGILTYFAMQSLFNIGVTLNMLPTKGMTLPFISYGGSSLISFCIGFGIYMNAIKMENGYR